MVPANLARVEGPNLILRLIEPDDAEYVHALRTNPNYNAHLSEVTGTATDQRRWIEGYKSREAGLSELYYVIERHDGVRCGLVRLYGIEEESFTWGSWILDHNKTRRAALESAVLSFGVGFELLDRPNALVDVRIENTRALSIYERMGMVELERDEVDIYFVYQRARYRADRGRYMALLGGGMNDDS
jgi:RimJ/RimL family protein N-acetyltransferase